MNVFFSALLRGLRKKRRKPVPSASRRPQSCRLEIEPLEDRTLPSGNNPISQITADLKHEQGVFADGDQQPPILIAESDVANIVVYSSPDQSASSGPLGSDAEVRAKGGPLRQEADKRQQETKAVRQLVGSPAYARNLAEAGANRHTAQFTDATWLALSGQNSGRTAPASAPVAAQQAALIGTMTGLTSSANPSMFFQTVTFTATVIADSGPGTPGGAVTFKEGASTLGTGALDINGQATLSIVPPFTFSVGAHSITAVYEGDATFATSTSAALSQTVTKADTTTSLFSMEPNPSVFGEGVRIHAIVTPVTSGAVTGLVTFKADGATVATYTLDLGNQGEAIVDVSSLSVGSRAITVEYSGDDNYNGSTSSSQTQTVTKAETTTALSSSPNPSTVGEPVTLTATVGAVAPGAGTPTGTVDFKDGANPLGTATLSGGQATFMTSSLPAGMRLLSAVYGGDGSFLGSTGESSHTVNDDVPPPPTAATHLTFSVQPPSTTPAGEPFSVTVQALDDFDNVDSAFSGDITISIGSNPSGGTLSGTLTVAAVNGEATFADLKIDKAGMGYTLLAASGGLMGDESMPFEITAATAHHLAFAQQPSNTVAGVVISPAVTVFVEDRFDNLVVTSTAEVTMAIGANPGAGTLSGTRTVKAVDGIATFRDLSINKVGINYTLVASSSTLLSAESFPFDITAATAHHLAFAQQPSNTVVDTVITPAVTVFVEDRFDNLVATDNTTAVSLVIGNNPGGGTLSGTTTVTASNGEATFDDLSIDREGEGYTLLAESGTLIGDESVSFDITAILFNVQSIEYLPTGQGTTGDLSNDNPQPFGEGYRFFPDAASAMTNTTARNIVRIRATVTPAAANVLVHFRAFDVDDPSVDPDIDDNGPDGRDNRGRVAGNDLDKPVRGARAANGYRGRLRPVNGQFATEGAIVSVATQIDPMTGAAIAEVELATSFKPGDNFRVVASTSMILVAGLNDTTSVPTIGRVMNFRGEATDQLSVWRRLHLEVDSMGRVTGNIVQGQILTVDPDPASNTIVLTTSLRLRDSRNRFESGVLVNNDVGFKVISNFSDGSVIRLEPRADGRMPTRGNFSMFDDDVYAEGQDVPMPSNQSFIALRDALQEAYVEPIVTLDNDSVQFLVHSGLRDRDDWDWDTEEQNTPVYWVAYLLAAFETNQPNRQSFAGDYADNDPDNERGQITGNTNSVRGGSLIFMESIRDVARERNGDPLFEEMDTVVHEIGHALFPLGDEPVTLFPASFRYNTDYIIGIRNMFGPRSTK